MQTLLQDIRYGIRMLIRNPGFTTVAVLTLALGIGANTAIFSVVNAVLLRPLPYKNPDQLVAILDDQPQVHTTPVSYPEYLDWREQHQIFSSVAAFNDSSYILTGKGLPEQIQVLRVSAAYLPLLGVEPILGRNLRPDEEELSGERVVLLSYATWKSRYGGDPAIIGKAINLSDLSFTIIGVLPRDFSTPDRAELLAGLRLNPQVAVRGLHFLRMYGRLRPGLNLAQARKEAQPVVERLKKERSTTHGLALFDAKEDMTQGTGGPLAILLGAVGFVLLIGCANVANLLLSQAVKRRREIAIRIAIGAGRWRLVRQLLTESILLGLCGGLCSLLVAKWSMDGLMKVFSERLPRWSEIQIDTRVMVFALCISVLTGVLFGLAPAWEAVKVSLNDSLKEGGRMGSGVSRHKRNALVVCEIALSLVLSTGAGLLLRSFNQLLHVNKGFNSDHVLTFNVDLPQNRYKEPAKQVSFFHQVLDQLRTLPGVESVGMINALPLRGRFANGDVGIAGHTFTDEDTPLADKCFASAGYFSTLRIPLIRGRYFSEQDSPDSPHVAIVNQEFVRKYFPNEDPLGKQIAFNWDVTGFQEVVGIVGDVKHDNLGGAIRPQVYVPYTQRPNLGFQFVLRTKSDPSSLISAARAQVLAIDGSQPLTGVETMDEVVFESLTDQRTAMWLLGAFAGLALILTIVGIFGVVSYTVSERTHEIGLRMTLGAQSWDVMRQILGEGLILALMGVGTGVAAVLILTRWMASQLYGVSPHDPLTIAAVSLLLTAVALAACCVPAQRAMRVDPMVALRHE
ncbi:MAG: ABC transporter permease [Candidatus Acidiferrales bacterium]